MAADPRYGVPVGGRALLRQARGRHRRQPPLRRRRRRRCASRCTGRRARRCCSRWATSCSAPSRRPRPRHPRRLLGAGGDHDRRRRRSRSRSRCCSSGRGPALLAGAIVGTYPPLIGATGDQLSEPLGAFLLLAAFVALALALRRRQRPWWYAASGALFGLTILTRTDLLPVPFLIAGIGGADRAGPERSLRAGAAALGDGGDRGRRSCWRRGRSTPPREEGRFIPVTKGSAAALFVGTYLPGGGTTIGMKEHLEAQLRAAHPEYNGTSRPTRSPPPTRSSCSPPSTPTSRATQALYKEAKKNLIHYSTTQPVAFAQMQWAKAKRMWFFYYRGGGVHYISTPMRIWQVVLVLAAGLGLLAGLIRRRDRLLGAALLTIAFSHLRPHDRGLPGPLQRPADAAADRRGGRGLVSGLPEPPGEPGDPGPDHDAGMELGRIGIWHSRSQGRRRRHSARDRGASATARCGWAAARRSSRRARTWRRRRRSRSSPASSTSGSTTPPTSRATTPSSRATTRTASCSGSASATRRRRATTRAR